MEQLSIIRTQHIRQFAQEKRLELIECSDHRLIGFELPPSRVVQNGQTYVVVPERLQNFGSVVLRLPEAVLRGRNLSTIFDGALLPSGYSHSFNWVEQGGFALHADKFHCNRPPTECSEMPDNCELAVLGIASHFGHFFTDCLDRIFAFEQAKLPPTTKFVVDALPIPQVRQIIDALGVDMPTERMRVVDRSRDHHARNLHIATLDSAKPAISLSVFQKLRERVLARFPQPHGDTQSIYVGRKDVQKRKILNQDEVFRELQGAGFAAFYPENREFKDSVAAFHRADMIVIAIGSSKFNLAFCRPGTKVVCLAPEGYAERAGAVSVMLRQLCALFQLELSFCSCRVAGANIGFDSDMTVDRWDLIAAMKLVEV